MIQKVNKTRGKQILSLLKEHGPLSMEAINRLMKPEQAIPRTRKSIRSLIAKNLVRKISIAKSKIFYGLNQKDQMRYKIASILKCNPEDVVQDRERFSNHHHQEIVEMWIVNVLREFPEAKIYREKVILKNKECREIIGWKPTDDTLVLPDFLAIVSLPEAEMPIPIAFEIELSRKAKSKIMSKLSKYSNETSVLGLVYICDTDLLSNDIESFYRGVRKVRDYRIGHFGENFLLFSDSVSPSAALNPNIQNCRRESISLQKWIDVFRTKNWRDVRNSDFEMVHLPVHQGGKTFVEEQSKNNWEFQQNIG